MTPAETAVLRLPGFSRLAGSALLNTIAFAGEQVVLGWLALDLTNSPLLVGVALGLRMAPMLLIGLPAGVLADRGDRLVFLRGAHTTMALALTRLGLRAGLGRGALAPHAGVGVGGPARFSRGRPGRAAPAGAHGPHRRR